MAHVVYDKTTNQPLMIVLNATPIHEESLQKLCQNDSTKGLHVVDKEVYETFKSHEEVVSAIADVAFAESSLVTNDG